MTEALFSQVSVVVLQNATEVDTAVRELASFGLPDHPLREKSWDGALFLKTILQEFGDERASCRVLDVGCQWSPMLPWLARLGFRNLYGIDKMGLESPLKRGIERCRGWRIRRSLGDLLQTDFEDGYFDVVTSISVVEHGVDPTLYAREMARILRPEGLLLTSTDYWPEGVDCSGLYPYGPEFGEMKVFDRSGIEDFVRTLEAGGFSLPGARNFDADERVVTWRRMDRSFTFVSLKARRL